MHMRMAYTPPDCHTESRVFGIPHSFPVIFYLKLINVIIASVMHASSLCMNCHHASTRKTWLIVRTCHLSDSAWASLHVYPRSWAKNVALITASFIGSPSVVGLTAEWSSVCSIKVEIHASLSKEIHWHTNSSAISAFSTFAVPSARSKYWLSHLHYHPYTRNLLHKFNNSAVFVHHPKLLPWNMLDPWD